jgi:DNA-binding response OmpR family regulator
VDDEADVMETLEDTFAMCMIHKARNFEAGKKLLERNTYDVAILDIMGVKGHELLQIADHKGIPALILTAHALSPDNLIKSIKGLLNPTCLKTSSPNYLHLSVIF